MSIVFEEHNVEVVKAKRGNGRKKKADRKGDAEGAVVGVDDRHDTERGIADIDSLCQTLQTLERQRRFALKQCIRGENAITAFVAWSACGFHTGLATEAEREKLWKKAGKMVREIDDGGGVTGTTRGGDGGSVADASRASDDLQPDTGAESVTGVVRISQISRKAWRDYEKALMEEMSRLAGELPVADWLSTDECRGISLGMLATIVGEAGNLSNYPNPAKLWRRLFGAPYEKDGKVMMPSRWRLEKGLSGEEWEEIGYSPRRHATMQQLKENIVRQNGDGPYRRRYDEARERTRTTHPEWWVCSKCEGTGKIGKKTCTNCKGTGEVKMHPHRHAQLLAAKRFVRDLWNKWHGVEEIPDWRRR
jgi:hypothetical protein